MMKMREEERSSTPLKELEKNGVQIKRPNSIPSVSPLPSSPSDISSSIRSDFG